MSEKKFYTYEEISEEIRHVSGKTDKIYLDKQIPRNWILSETECKTPQSLSLIPDEYNVLRKQMRLPARAQSVFSVAIDNVIATGRWRTKFDYEHSSQTSTQPCRYQAYNEIVAYTYERLRKETRRDLPAEVFKYYALCMLWERLLNRDVSRTVEPLALYLGAVGRCLYNGQPMAPQPPAGDGNLLHYDKDSRKSIQYQIRCLDYQALRILASMQDQPDDWMEFVSGVIFENDTSSCNYGCEPIVSIGNKRAASAISSDDDFPHEWDTKSIQKWLLGRQPTDHIYEFAKKAILESERVVKPCIIGSPSQFIPVFPEHKYEKEMMFYGQACFTSPSQLCYASEALVYGFQELRLPATTISLKGPIACRYSLIERLDVLEESNKAELQHKHAIANWCVKPPQEFECLTKIYDLPRLRKQFVEALMG